MIVTFCGHAHFSGTAEHEQRILAFLENNVGDRKTDFYLGEYGEFDRFAYHCCKSYQCTHPGVSLVLVTPYMTVDYQRTHLERQKERYDAIVYPDLEEKPLRYAIAYRNRYMVDCADLVISYIDHDWGGAYKTYRYAKKKGKVVFNLAEFS